MDKSINQNLKTLLKQYEGKKIHIFTKSGLHYITSNLLVFEDTVSFSDKYGIRVLISLDEIRQITEVKNENA